MKKRLFALSAAATMLLSSNIFAEEKPITVTINNEVIATDVAPEIINDRTMLPMRAIFEALGADITWIPADQLIFATKQDCLVVMQIGNEIMSVQKVNEDSNSVITLDSVPYISNDRTMVPVRAVAEVFGADVQWIPEDKTVAVTLEEAEAEIPADTAEAEAAEEK